MTELVTVQTASPRRDGYGGLTGVWLHDKDTGLKVHFAVTFRSALVDGKPVRGSMNTAVAMMKDIIDAHVAGLIEIDAACFWTDRPVANDYDQRPASEQRERSVRPYDSPDEEAPQSKGDPDGHEYAFQISRNADGGYKLKFRLGKRGGNGATRDRSVVTPIAVKMLTEALEVAGYSPLDWQDDKPYNLDIEFAWDHGKILSNGKPASDYRYFKVAPRPASGDAAF